jgi:hypothetical protein
MKRESPYGKTAVLKQDIRGVECWNFTDNSKWNLPCGTRIHIDNVQDATHTTVCVIDENGQAPGVPCPNADGSDRIGYRFIINNTTLSQATGIHIPRKTRDIVGEIMAYESGEMIGAQQVKLFRRMKKTGIGRYLQGHYSSKM